jgi:hypothetical protein
VNGEGGYQGEKRIGSIPSWLGGKIQFWAEFGRASWAQFQLQLGQTELGNKSLDRYFCSLLWHVHYRMMIQYVIYVVYIIQYIIYIMLPILNFAEP